MILKYNLKFVGLFITFLLFSCDRTPDPSEFIELITDTV